MMPKCVHGQHVQVLLFIPEYKRFDIDEIFWIYLTVKGSKKEAVLFGLLLSELTDSEDNLFLVFAPLIKARRQGVVLDQTAFLCSPRLSVEMDPSLVSVAIDWGSRQVTLAIGQI